MPRFIATATALFVFTVAGSGQRISVGVVGGTHLTNNFPKTDVSMPADPFGNPAYRFQFSTGRRSFIFGATLEGRLTERFAIEANALHRPMKSKIIFTEFFEDGSARETTSHLTSVRAWEFPLLLKYTLPPLRGAGGARLFLTAGPSFRTQEEGGAAEPSQLGVSAGLGAAFHLGRFRLSPTLRYTRWRREWIAPRYATKPDQIEFLTSFAYETRARTRRLAGRKLEIGAILGLPLTRGFLKPNIGDAADERFGYLVGLTAQTDLTSKLALEVDAIYKPLRAVDRVFDTEHPFTVLTWQFPILAKFRFQSAKWTPFVAAGPSVRLAGNLNGFEPSHFGFTAGAGLETRSGAVRLAPAVRYTRWLEDSNRGPRTNPNAVEIVFGVSF